jgi:hypothetical protein
VIRLEASKANMRSDFFSLIFFFFFFFFFFSLFFFFFQNGELEFQEFVRVEMLNKQNKTLEGYVETIFGEKKTPFFSCFVFSFFSFLCFQSCMTPMATEPFLVRKLLTFARGYINEKKRKCVFDVFFVFSEPLSEEECLWPRQKR